MSLSDPLAAWLARVGVPLGPTGYPGPDWLDRADATALRAAASRLEVAADDQDAIRLGLEGLLGEAATSLGWEGGAATGAKARGRRQSARLAEMADLLRRLARELAHHAAHLEDWREQLRRVLDEAEQHAADAGDLLRRPNPLTAVRESGAAEDPVASLHRCAGHVRDVVATAEAEDRACTARVVDLGAEVLRLAAVAEGDDWVAGLAPPGARQVLTGLGVLGPPPGG